MLDPVNFALLARRKVGGMWRVTYADKPDLTDEEYVKRRETVFAKLLPGNPQPSEYKNHTDRPVPHPQSMCL